MNIVERVKTILVNPKEEWQVIKDEASTIQELFTQYAIILAAIPAIAGFIGFSVFGYGFGINLPISSGFGWAILTYILSLIGAFVVGFIIDSFAPTFGSTKDLTASMKVAVYASTASWVGGLFSLIPFLSFVSFVAGIYTLVLMYFGLKIIKDVPEDKMVGYFITVVVVAIVVYMIIGAITSGVFLTGFAISAM
jgi:Yip1 domain